MSQLNSEYIHNLLQQPPQLIKHVTGRLNERNRRQSIFPGDGVDWQSASAILFLLGRHPQNDSRSGEPCLILNKRSVKVRQPQFEGQTKGKLGNSEVKGIVESLTNEHLAYYFDDPGIVVTGDALFREGIGRTDLPGGDYNTLLRSIRNKLFSLPDETKVMAGHGPESDIGHEKNHNPFFV